MPYLIPEMARRWLARVVPTLALTCGGTGRRRPRGLAVLLLAAIGIGATTTAAAPKWLRLEANGFTILSDASVRDVETFALQYAAFRQTTEELFAPVGRRTPHALIVLFQREKMLQEHVPPSRDRDTNIAVFSIEVDDAAVLALALAGDRARALRLAFEFDTMWTIRRYGYAAPTWMAQGAGEVLSTLTLRRGRRVLGLPDDRFLRPLANEGWMNWEAFFGTGLGSKAYKGRRATGQFHGQAWALMHAVLLRSDDGRVRFQRLASELRQRDAVEAVEAVLEVKELNTEGRRLLSRTAAPRELPFDEAAVRRQWRVVPATATEVQVRLADLLAASGRPEQADWQIEQALAAAPDSPLVQEAAARRDLRQQRPDLAVERYRTAIALGSTNPVAYLRSAADRLHRSQGGRFDREGGGLPREVTAALAEIREALRLDPGSDEGYRLLGRAFYVSRELPETAVEELSVAVGPGEAGATARLFRGLVYGRLGRWSEARADFVAAAAEPDATDGVEQEATRQIEGAELQLTKQEVEQLVRGGDWDGARQRLADARAQATSADLKTNYQRMAEWLAKNEARLRRDPPTLAPAATD